jgi:hypothetical protein
MNNPKRALIAIGILLSGLALSPYIAQSFVKFSWQLFANAYLYQPIPAQTATATSTVTLTPTSTVTLTPTPTITPVPDNDDDGVDDSVEDGAPNDGDGNNDGIPDSDQHNVTSLPNAYDGAYLTVVSPEGTTLTDVTTIDNPSPENAPQEAIFPEGFISFGLEGVSEGETILVTIILHSGMIADTYWKYGPTPDDPAPHWYEFLFDGVTGAQIDGNAIALYFVDGQRGDADLTVNTSIQEPGAPALHTFWQALLPFLQR